MAGATAIVLYPRTPTSTFNKDYYLNTHMALCEKHWKKHGLRSYSVAELSADAAYSHSAVMEWDSHESIANALQDPGTQEIMADVTNYSSEKPVMLHGGVVGRG